MGRVRRRWPGGRWWGMRSRCHLEEDCAPVPGIEVRTLERGCASSISSIWLAASARSASRPFRVVASWNRTNSAARWRARSRSVRSAASGRRRGASRRTAALGLGGCDELQQSCGADSLWASPNTRSSAGWVSRPRIRLTTSQAAGSHATSPTDTATHPTLGHGRADRPRSPGQERHRAACATRCHGCGAHRATPPHPARQPIRPHLDASGTDAPAPTRRGHRVRQSPPRLLRRHYRSPGARPSPVSGV